MKLFIPWTEIESFHNVRKFLKKDPTGWWGEQHVKSIAYKCKVKLHGTNSAVQVYSDGTLQAQSRNSFITPEKDNAGFARWVESTCCKFGEHPDYWNSARSHIIYGEWVGSGIQKGVAVSEIPKKCFAVFAARTLNEAGEPGEELIVEPRDLMALTDGIPDVYVLPWYTGSRYGSDTIFSTFHMNPIVESDGLTSDLETINHWVDKIEAEDPWVQETFGVKGTGEGLVFYPANFTNYSDFCNLVFKAKGEKHKNIKTGSAVQLNPETASSIDGFVELVLTTARLEQGAGVVGGFEQKLTGQLVNWCVADVEKECQDELEASGLTFEQVKKPLSTKARTWYLNECKTR